MQPNAPLTFRDYLVPIRRSWRLIAALVVITTAVVAVYTATRPVAYTASTKVFIGPQSAVALGISSSEPSAQGIANEAILLTSTEVAAVIGPKIHYPGSPAALAGSVAATPSQTTSVLTITSTQPTSALAANVVNAYAQEFITRNLAAQQGLGHSQIATLQKQIAALKGPNAASQRQNLEDQIQQLQVQDSSVIGQATQIDPATGGSATRKSALEFGILAAIGSLIGACLLAYLKERLDPRLKGIGHAEMVYQHPVLATVWHDPDIAFFVDEKPGLSPRSREAFRDLRIGLDLAAGENMKTMVVTSAIPYEGKSTVTRNLALALAESGRRVMLVDADLRKPAQAKALGVKGRSGLAELLAGTRTLEQVTTEVQIDVSESKAGSKLAHEVAAASVDPAHSNGHAASGRPGFRGSPSLFFISAGAKPPNPQGSLESDEFRALIQDLSQKYDAVIIDSTPLTLVSDAIPIVRNVDGVLLVARSGTDSRSARHAHDIMNRVPEANVVGLVVNDVPETAAAAYGKGYGYGYGYYGYGNVRGYGYEYGESSPEAEPADDGAAAGGGSSEPPPLRLHQ